jgi:hypothetical protein
METNGQPSESNREWLTRHMRAANILADKIKERRDLFPEFYEAARNLSVVAMATVARDMGYGKEEGER